MTSRRAEAGRTFDVCRAEDLPDGARAMVDIGRRTVAVFNIRGDYYALPNVCSHQLGPLCEGRITGTLTASEADGWSPRWELEGEVISCPWHGLEFHIPSGRCLAHPEVKLRSYEVSVEDGVVKLRV